MITGPRTFIRVDDDKGQLIAYVGGESPQQMKERAEIIDKAVNGEIRYLGRELDPKNLCSEESHGA